MWYLHAAHLHMGHLHKGSHGAVGVLESGPLVILAPHAATSISSYERTLCIQILSVQILVSSFVSTDFIFQKFLSPISAAIPSSLVEGWAEYVFFNRAAVNLSSREAGSVFLCSAFSDSVSFSSDFSLATGATTGWRGLESCLERVLEALALDEIQ